MMAYEKSACYLVACYQEESENRISEMQLTLDKCWERVAALETEIILMARSDRDRLEPVTDLNRRYRDLLSRVVEVTKGGEDGLQPGVIVELGEEIRRNLSCLGS